MAKCKNCENELIYCDRKGDKGWAHIIPTDEPICKNPIPETVEMDLKETRKWMNYYHDKHVNAQNKLNEIQELLDEE